MDILLLKSRAVVPDEDDRPAINANFTDLDQRRIPTARVLHCIGKKIGEHLFHKAGIAIHDGQFSNAPVDLSFLAVGLKLTKHALHQ